MFVYVSVCLLMHDDEVEAACLLSALEILMPLTAP